MCKECKNKGKIKIKVCKSCNEEKSEDEFAKRNLAKGICRVCNYLLNHQDIEIIEGWNLEGYRKILHYILNKKIKYINELESIINKDLIDIINVLKILKINGGGYKVIVKTQCKYCKKDLELNVFSYTTFNNHFCNSECSGKWQSENLSGKNSSSYNSIQIQCDWCGKDICVNQFEIKNYNNHLCDKECYDKWQIGNQITVKCEECEEDFSIPEYKYKRNKTKKFYCCKECYENNRKIK